MSLDLSNLVAKCYTRGTRLGRRESLDDTASDVKYDGEHVLSPNESLHGDRIALFLSLSSMRSLPLSLNFPWS